MKKIAAWKKAEVDELKNLMLGYDTIAIADLAYMPSKQLQDIRRAVRGNIVIKASKKNLIRIAIEEAAKQNSALKALTDKIKGQPALILSKSNSFALYRMLEKNKSKAFAKPNSTATSEIVVHKGETNFSPGPILAELQKAGIPVAVQGNKVVVKEDKVVARSGDKISADLASALARLEIMPAEIKLALVAAYEKGTIFSPEVLNVNVDEIMNRIISAEQKAVNLSVNSGYITKRTAELAIIKAVTNAMNLGVNAVIYEPRVMEILIANAYSKAKALETTAKPKNA